jgi:hypothetical protein
MTFNIKMFAKQHEPTFVEDLQIQMRVLKGNHMMLKKRFNKYFEGNGHKTSEEYSELFQSLQEVSGHGTGQLAAV